MRVIFVNLASLCVSIQPSEQLLWESMYFWHMAGWLHNRMSDFLCGPEPTVPTNTGPWGEDNGPGWSQNWETSLAFDYRNETRLKKQKS